MEFLHYFGSLMRVISRYRTNCDIQMAAHKKTKHDARPSLRLHDAYHLVAISERYAKNLKL